MGIFLENFKIAFNVNSLYLTYLPNNSMEGYKSCPGPLCLVLCLSQFM